MYEISVGIYQWLGADSLIYYYYYLFNSHPLLKIWCTSMLQSSIVASYDNLTSAWTVSFSFFLLRLLEWLKKDYNNAWFRTFSLKSHNQITGVFMLQTCSCSSKSPKLIVMEKLVQAHSILWFKAFRPCTDQSFIFISWEMELISPQSLDRIPLNSLIA